MTAEHVEEAKTTAESATSNWKYNKLVKDIISELEKGIIPWQKPWTCVYHKNAITGREYSGWNIFVLMTGSSPYWITYNQAKAYRDAYAKKSNCRTVGGEMIGIRKEELKNYRTVFFWSVTHREDKETGEEKKIFFLKTFNVYNVDQGVWPEEFHQKLKKGQSVMEVKDAEELIQAYADGLPAIDFGGNRAYYRPTEDKIQIPPRDQFRTTAGYYNTLYHELIHSTGAEKRLNRAGIKKVEFGSEEYSKEELIAELGATFLCAEARIERVIEDSTAYISSWLKALKGDPRMVVMAASQAQKAAAWVMGTKPNAHLEVEPAKAAA